MSNEQQQGALEPLWNDNDIGRYVKANEPAWQSKFEAAYFAMKYMKRVYEADRATSHARIRALNHEYNEVEQVLGAALGYPRYCDDLENFPAATEADGVCTGEHTPATLAQEAAQRIRALEARVSELEDTCQSLADALTTEDNDPGHIGTVDWVGPSGKTWKVDLYQEDDEDE